MPTRAELRAITAQITAAYLANNAVDAPLDINGLASSVYDALADCASVNRADATVNRVPKPKNGRLAAADDLGADQIAARLGKSKSWVEHKIAEVGFQFHHHIGSSPRWDEQEYQQFRQAVIAAERIKRGGAGKPRLASGSSSAMAIGISTGLYGPEDVAKASARVLGSPRRRKTATPLKRSASKPSGSSATTSSTANIQVFPSPSQPSNF
jgi:predicted DNA-binding transcriptional regulator AlpA